MLQNVDSIIGRVQALLDNPSGSRFSSDYIMPFIDQEYAEMDVDLERLGMQYIEEIAVFDVPANTTDLTYALAPGQPLEFMKLPKRVKWKVQGAPDLQYQPSEFVQELAETAGSNQGIRQWRFADGAIEVTPSAITVTIKIYFDPVSTDIYDPAQKVIRGTAHILALRAAATIASINNGMGTMQKKLDQKRDRAWISFCGLVVMNSQKKRRTVQPIHRHTSRGGSPVIYAPTS